MRAIADERTLEIVDRRRRKGVVRHRGWLVRRLLLIADVGGLVAALLVAEWLVGRHDDIGMLAAHTEIIVFLVSLPGWIVVAKLYGLYDRDEEQADQTTGDDLSVVFNMVTVCTFLFWAGTYVTGLAHPRPPKLVIFWLSAIVLISLARGAARMVARRSIIYVQNTLIVGAGEVGRLVAGKLLHHPEYGINVVGFVDERPRARAGDLGQLTLLGGTERLPALVRLFDVERVIIAFPNEPHHATLDVLRDLADLNVRIDIVPLLFELLSPATNTHTIEGLPLVGVPPRSLSRSSRLLKRLVDIVLASVGLLLLALPFTVICLAIKLDSPGRVFFRQVRMGEGNRTFFIWKFRTMASDADENKADLAHLNRHLGPGGDPRMFKINDDPRVTLVGKLLRRFAVDELPQLINVLVGSMSLVGPRPLILDEDRHVDAWARQRLSLKPGLTGPWQVLGRNDIPFGEMVRLDCLYVSHWTLWGDFLLLVRTVPAVLRASRNTC